MILVTFIFDVVVVASVDAAVVAAVGRCRCCSCRCSCCCCCQSLTPVSVPSFAVALAPTRVPVSHLCRRRPLLCFLCFGAIVFFGALYYCLLGLALPCALVLVL